MGVPGVTWHTQILADQLTLFQPGRPDYAHQPNLSGSLWLRQPVEDLRFDLGISFYGFTRCSWTIPNLRKSPFVIRALLAPCAAVAVR